LGGGGGGAARPLWAQSGGAGGARWAGRAAGPRGGAAGPKMGKEGEGRGERIFLFFNIYFLDECVYIFKQLKRMHGSAWCIKQNKIL
jgi:hypothetical protein